MPVLPRGGEDELNREGQVSSRRVAAAPAAPAAPAAFLQWLTLPVVSAETAGGLLEQPAEDAHVQELSRNGEASRKS